MPLVQRQEPDGDAGPSGGAVLWCGRVLWCSIGPWCARLRAAWPGFRADAATCLLLPVRGDIDQHPVAGPAVQIPAAGATARSEEKISRMRLDTLYARVRILVYEYLGTSLRER
jgi:hypothetical protein